MGAASAPDPAQPGDGKTAANVTEGQGQPSEPNSQDAGSSASATGTTTAEANAPPPSAPQQPQQEQPQSAQPQGPPPKAEPQPPPRAAPAGSAQGPAAEPMPACHYEVLGVEHNCTEDEIKKAYRDLSKKYHPDKNFGCTDAKERFQRINEAKILLLDRKQRVAYDAKIYTEKLLKKIGADFNQQVQQWVEFTMLQQEGWKVDYVLVARGLTDVLPNHFNLFMRQSGARFMSMHSPTQGVVLIGGAPAMIKRGQDLVNNFVEELNGDRAPADGAVFIVPVQYQQKMPLIANHFQSWMWTYGTQMYQVGRDREGRDRVVIRGTRWPAVVAMLQQAVDFTGGILHMSGQYLDCWRCAHMCELNGIVNAQFISGHLLPPQRDPDKNTVRELFKYVLQLDNQQLSKMSLIDLAVHALTLKQQRQPTCATVRAASSQAVYAEYSQLPAKQSAPLLLAFARLQTSMSQVGSFIQQRFVDQNLQTLQRLGPFLDCSDAMLLRSKGFIAAKEAVPDDAQWHRWDDVLRPDGRLANFWKDLRKFFQQNVGLAKPWGVSTPPADWHTVPDVMCDVLKRCVQGTNLLVDLEKGIFRPKEPSAPAAPPAPKTVAPPLPTGRSTSSASGAATTRAPVEEHLTLVEHAEDVMFELSNERKHDAAAYMELSMVTQKLQKRLGQDADKISKNWYSKFELSFDVKQVTSVTSPDHHWVKLTLPGRKRADVRERERRQKGDQKEDFEVVQRILPGLLPKKEPLTSMQEKDFCALLSLLSRETTERCHQDLPKNTLQKLCGGNTNTPELLRSIAPFTMTMVMQAVATLHKRGHKFEEKALLPILRAAALEMHDSDGPPGRLWVPLTVVRDAVLAVCKEPFLDLFKKKHDTDAKLLTTSCALRICTELVLPGTEHLTKLCPPCLSESYGSFRVFAELCGALATLYGAVSTHLGTSGASHQESQVLIRLEEAFGKLANLCQRFCNCISSRDPRGLARLAYAFAKIGDSKHKQNKKLSAASKLGLAQLSKAIQSSDMSKEAGWDMTHLSEIACSYIQEPDQAVYKKIAEAAETLHTDTQSTLKRETLVGFITAFRQTGSMKELYAFLKLLNSSKWFKKNLNQKEVKGLHGEDLVILVTAMVNAEDFETLEELETHLKQDPRKDLDSKHLIDMLKETNACGNQKVKSLGIILQQKIVDAIARRCPPDLDTVLQLCSDERARSKLIDVCSHRDRLERIPKPNEGSAWSKFNPSLESSLAPFVRGKCRAPRLEAAYAGRIMQGLEQCGVFDSPPKTHSSDFAKNMLTAALHFSEDMFASMPALVQTLIQGVSNLPSAREDGEMLKTLVRKMLQVGKVAEKDDALTTWTSQIEDAILKAAGSGIYEMRWNDAELTMGGKDFKQLHTKVKDALGESWLSIILARSRRLSWLPGQPIQFHPPRPRAVLRDLAEKYGEVLGQRLKNEVLALTPEAPAPRSLRSAPRGAGEARSRSREREREVPKAKAKAKAKAAPRAALTVFGGTDVPLGQALEGEYYKDGMNHGKFIFKKIGEDPTGSVDAVFLYYWNGEDCREDLGWWFGDKVGGTEAFMHNPNLGAGSQPPFNGWDKGVKIQPAAFGLGAVKGKGRAKPSAARGPPGPVPPAKRPREEEERHVRLKQWLTGLDEGKGDMLAYYEALKEEFDGDLTQIAAARIENNPRASPVEQVEPTFWEAIKCTKGVHRLKFARGIISLPAS